MNQEKPFEIRSYSRSELACMYLPDICPQSASKTFKNWINKYPGLAEALTAIGFKPTDRRYTPAQVQLIVNALGEP